MDAVLPQDGGGRRPEPIARLGKYTLIKALAKGGMAQVFLAQRDGAEEICVLKQLLHEVAEHETAVKRFHREAKLAAYLNHRHIARVLDAGFEAGTFCIAMEYVLGKDLEAMSHHLVKQGRLLPYPVSLAAITGALDGLAYAHQATDPSGKPLQLVHRDLSPRNVMLSVDGVTKVIDFGVARSDSGDFRTAPGMLVGTLRYVSPEQAVAEVVDARSDIYSLSVVLHELLTGNYLVPSGEPMKVLKYVVTETLPFAHELNPELPPALGMVIARGLAKNREDRWPDAASYRRALLEAAGPMAQVDEEHLGSFVRSFFQDDVAVGEAVISFGKERFVREQASGSETKAKALSEETRTGYAPVAEPGGDEVPHLGTVVPVELTSPGASTASLLRAETASRVTTHLVDRDRASISPTRTAMFDEVEARAMVDAAEASSTTPQAAALGDELQTPAELGRTGLVPRSAVLAVVAMFFLVLGALGVAEMRTGAREITTVPVTTVQPVETAPRPVAAVAAAPVVEAAPTPEAAPASEVAPAPAVVKPERTKKATPRSETTPSAAPEVSQRPTQKASGLSEVKALLSQLEAEADAEKKAELATRIKDRLRSAARALNDDERAAFNKKHAGVFMGRVDANRLSAAYEDLRRGVGGAP